MIFRYLHVSVYKSCIRRLDVPVMGYPNGLYKSKTNVSLIDVDTL